MDRHVTYTQGQHHDHHDNHNNPQQPTTTHNNHQAAQCLTFAPAPVVEYLAPAPVENVAPAPAVASTLILSGESCHDELRDATEVPTVSIRLHDEWPRAERVLRARAGGFFFRQLKKRDAQLAAQLLSHRRACEVARGSPDASLLVPVAMREQKPVFEVACL